MTAMAAKRSNLGIKGKFEDCLAPWPLDRYAKYKDLT